MIARRLSVMWPILILLAAAIWALQSLGTLPPFAADLIARAWPVVFIATGLMLLIGRRVRFGNLIAVVVSVVLVGGVTAAAYSQQATKIVADQHKPFEQALDSSITSVKSNVTSLLTEIEVKPGDSTKSAISGEFVGSRDSQISGDYQTDGTTGTFTLVEAQSGGIPTLGELGRGKLTLFLPTESNISQLAVNIAGHGDIQFDAAGTTLTDLSITGGTGQITLGTLPTSLTNVVLTAGTGPLDIDASATSLKNLTAVLTAGNLSVKLPTTSGLIGTLKTGGDVTITVPTTIAANVKLSNGAANNPTFSQADYILSLAHRHGCRGTGSC